VTGDRIAVQAISTLEDWLKIASNLLRNSKAPVIIVGHAARINMAAMTEFAERRNCPVVTLFKGKGLSTGTMLECHPSWRHYG